MSRLSLRAALALAGILITIGGCAESPSSSVTPSEEWQLVARADGPSFSRSGGGSASELIGPAGGTVTLGENRLVFPKGALAQGTVITMTQDPRYAGVQLQPHGLQFPTGREPVLTLSGGGSSLASFRQVAIAYVGDSGQILEILPTTALGKSGKFRTELQHFSAYVLGGS
ncbi:MAG TPA: hypothetical protein VFX98_06745 [Longimicrobiaceae bacterium]|nr:hypothetical protein [Longimicrobiaceae bacterium]